MVCSVARSASWRAHWRPDVALMQTWWRSGQPARCSAAFTHCAVILPKICERGACSLLAPYQPSVGWNNGITSLSLSLCLAMQKNYILHCPVVASSSFWCEHLDAGLATSAVTSLEVKGLGLPKKSAALVPQVCHSMHQPCEPEGSIFLTGALVSPSACPCHIWQQDSS